MNYLYLLRHAQTRLDFSCPPNAWDLSQDGIVQARNLISLLPKWLDTKVDVIICSEEKKTSQTVLPFARSQNLKLQKDHHFNELNSHFMPEINQDQYLKCKREIFLDLNRKFQPKHITHKEDSIKVFETAQEGLNRFLKGLYHLHLEYPTQNILLCSHGTMITLFTGYLKKNLHNGNKLFENWENLGFCTMITIQNEQITQICRYPSNIA